MKSLDSFTVERLEEIRNSFLDRIQETAPSIGEIFALIDIALVVTRSQQDAEQFGVGFIVCKPNELPRRADPTKVVLTFTDSGLGHEALI